MIHSKFTIVPNNFAQVYVNIMNVKLVFPKIHITTGNDNFVYSRIAALHDNIKKSHCFSEPFWVV